jgi:class 3 adenylate cyclase/tetratricopeptide (TPR) repeat protein
VPTCAKCGQENPEGFRFCGACAAPLESEIAERREERKVVTVLFCDLVGSTARAERLDPEDVRALLSRYHERVRAELEQWGGTVEKFIGDAVMALFGAPVAREDDPERALRAALAVRDWTAGEPDVQVRIGVTTGETLVALGTRPELGEAMAAGDVVNTAARLQMAARVDGILVDETTFRATERSIEYLPAEPVEAKGKQAPVVVWEAVQARSRFGVDVRQIGATPLVGRERERSVLIEALARAKAERSPQLVTLVGVPGIGKSRLVWELFRHIEGESELVTWRQGRSLPYGEGVAFWALGEIVKAQAGILETDTEDEATEKLVRTVRELVPEDRDGLWVERHLRRLVGLESDAAIGVDRGEAFAAWRRFLEALAEQRPVVLVFEDLHFAEDGLLDFVDHLADWATGVPLLIVGTSRPELLARRPSWGGGKPNAVTMSLSPLSDEQTAGLVHALLDRPVLDAELQRTLLERAGGNPLYAEEFARIVATGREPAELPETVQGIVAARLDLLPLEEKRVLHDASVVGKVFWLGALASMDGATPHSLEQHLHALERKEFLRRERTPSVAGETEYAFRHILVRDVAYGQIPRAERADKHRLAAQWIESLGRPEDHAELLAHHYLSALELGRATGADTTRYLQPARAALSDAGNRALALHAPASAIRFYEAAIDLFPDDGAVVPDLLFSFGRALASVDDERTAATLARARDLFVSEGAHARAAEVCALLAEYWWNRGQRERAGRHLEQARALVEREGTATASKAWVLSQISRYEMLAANNDSAVRVGRQALAMAEGLDLDAVRAHVLNNIGSARCASGDTGGIEDLEQSIAIGKAIDSPDLARAYNNLATMFASLGHIRRNTELRDKAVEAGRRLGNLSTARFAAGAQTLWRYSLGNWNECVEETETFLEESRKLGGSYQDAYLLSTRAVIAAARGDDEDALAGTERALELARGAGDPQVVLPVLAESAFVEAEVGRLEAARRHGLEFLSGPKYVTGAQRPDSTLALVAHQLQIDGQLRATLDGSPPEDLWTHPIRACLDGDFVAAAEIYAEMGLRTLEAHARLRGAMRLLDEARYKEADEQLERSLAFWRSVGATRYVRTGESLLGKSAEERTSAEL